MSGRSYATRRRFLELLASGGAGAAVLARLAATQEAFARHAAPSGPIAGQEFQALARDYLLDPGVLYLNHASIGTVPRPVLTALREYLRLCESNPWLYMWSEPWQGPREEVRGRAARLLRCSAAEIAITHNTTEGFNLLAQGLRLGSGDEVLFSSLNHPGASICWWHLAGSRGFRVRQFDFPVARAADMTADDVLDVYDQAITPATRVLVFPHIDNIVGLRHPLGAMTALARDRGVEFVAADGAQSAGMIPVDLAASGIDFYATSSHKWIQSPKGLGLFFAREAVRESLRPMWVTWGQERWAGSARIFEDYGTRNLAELLALGHALDYQEALGEAPKNARYEAMFDRARQIVDEAPGLIWRSPRSWDDAASLFAVEVLGRQAGPLAAELFEEHGVVVRAFEAPGINALRVSPNVATSDDEVQRFFSLLRD